MIFSPSKAHLFSKSRLVSSREVHPSRRGLSELVEDAMRAAVRATQKAADEPRPDPYGSSVVMMTVAGLNLQSTEQDSRNLKIPKNLFELKLFCASFNYPRMLVYNQRNVEIPEESHIFSSGIFCSSTKTATDLRVSVEQEVGVEGE